MPILGLNSSENMTSSQNVSFAKKEKVSKKPEQKSISVDKIVTVIDEESKKKSNRVAFAVGGSVLGVTALATVLNPRTFNKLVPKIRLWTQSIKFKHQEHGHAVHFRKFSEKVVKTAEKAATFLEVGNNLNSAKDLYIKRLCVQKHSFDWIKGDKFRSIMQKIDNVFINGYAGKKYEINDMLVGASDELSNKICLSVLKSIYLALWTLLFVIPGIVKGYSYYLAEFIARKNPKMSASDCITKSRELMDGHKWELFVFQLSFIGWHLLAILTCGILYIWLTPYIMQATIVYIDKNIYKLVDEQPKQEELVEATLV